MLSMSFQGSDYIFMHVQNTSMRAIIELKSISSEQSKSHFDNSFQLPINEFHFYNIQKISITDQIPKQGLSVKHPVLTREDL
jgi:hypothetical protein